MRKAAKNYNLPPMAGIAVGVGCLSLALHTRR